MKEKDNSHYVNWARLARSPNGIYEIWRTPTKYMICSHYNRKFKYFNNKNDAINEFYKLIK